MSTVIQNGFSKSSNNTCNCCPYGYHIDLDFIKYCEQMNNSSLTEGQLRRRDRRRERQSMEVMLGLQMELQKQQMDFNLAEQILSEVHSELKNQPPPPPPRANLTESPIIPHYNRLPLDHHSYDFLNDAVCDFERTLERSKKPKVTERKSSLNRNFEVEKARFLQLNNGDCIPNHKKNNSPQYQYNTPISRPQKDPDQTDADRQRKDTPYPFPTVLGNRSHVVSTSTPIRESSPPDDTLDRISVVSNCSNSNSESNLQLQQIREQMAFSLQRMRDLEEQVKMIPGLLEQVRDLKEERRNLQVQLKSDKSPSPQSQGSQNSQIFQPYRVSPVSLGNLEKHIKINKQSKTVGTSTNQTLKRDVGCSPITIPVPLKTLHSVSSATDLSVPINNNHSNHLYREFEVKKSIELALIKYKREKMNNMVTVGTQISKISHGNNVIEGPVTGVSVASQCEARSPSPKLTLSFNKTTHLDIVGSEGQKKVTVDRGVNTEDQLEQSLDRVPKISLKAITDFQSTRSRSFALGETDKPVVRRKTRETQTQPQLKQSIGVQHSQKVENKSVQSGVTLGSVTKTTDTGDLLKMRNQLIMTERVSKKDQQSTTQDLVKRRDYGVNTAVETKTTQLRTTASNTNRVETKAVGVSCNVEIKQQKIAVIPSPDDSKIPRPSALFSPTSQRKFVRQNTFTVPKNSKLPSPTNALPSPLEHSESKQESICPAEALLRLSSQQKTTNNSLLEASLIKKEEMMPEKLEEIVLDAEARESEDPDLEQYKVDFDQFPKSPSVEYLESNVDDDEDFDEDDEDKLGNMQPIRPSLPPPTSISTLRLSQPDRVQIKPSKEMQAALKVLNDNLKNGEPNESVIYNAKIVAAREWFQISSVDTANPLNVEDYLDYFEECSSDLLRFMVNLTDPNGNTSLHYAVSHGNFDVVSVLLDSKVCHINQTNNAGYTCVMLVSLAELQIPEHRTVVKRLFQMSDVNIRALKHSQTSLMLAVSHGNLDMVQMLIEAGADINIQDDDGSTSLMCAAEHGHIDIVKYLLAQPDCDSTKQDVDGSTALKISLEAGYHDIGCLLYAHEHLLRNKMKKRDKKDSTHSLGMSSSQSSLH